MAFKDDDFDFKIRSGEYGGFQEFNFDPNTRRYAPGEFQIGNDFDFKVGEFQIGNDFDFRIGQFQLQDLYANLSRQSDPSNFDSGVFEELYKGVAPERYDKEIRWSFRGDEEKAKQLLDLAAKALLRHHLQFASGTHLGHGRRLESHRGPVRIDYYNKDGDFISTSSEEVDGAIQVETIFAPKSTDVNIWASPPIRRVKITEEEEEGECEGKDYLWIGMRMVGSMDCKALLHVWEPWPETSDVQFVGPDEGELMRFVDYVENPESIGFDVSPFVCYTGQTRRFMWQRCVGRKGGPAYAEGLSPETRENTYQNFQFDTQVPEDLDEIWGDGSRPRELWHGGTPTINWNGGTVYVSRYKAYFCGPGRAHDPDDSSELWFESYHCDPEDPEKEFDYMHRYPDEAMGWTYNMGGQGNQGPPIYDEYPSVKWSCKGEIRPGKYYVKLSAQRTQCVETEGVTAQVRIKVGKPKSSDPNAAPLPKCRTVSATYEIDTPGGSYLLRHYLPYGNTPYEAAGWRDLSYYEDLHYPVNLKYGPGVAGDNAWWEGHIAIDAKNKVIEYSESTNSILLAELGFDLGAAPPPLESSCCTSTISRPVADEYVKPFPAPTGPVKIPSYLYPRYYIYFYATVISATSEGQICLIQITSQSAYTGCNCQPYGYGYVFDASGYYWGEEQVLGGVDEELGEYYLPPEGGDYSAGDQVIIVNIAWESTKKIVRHVGDPWFDDNPVLWPGPIHRSMYVCPDGEVHQAILEDMGILTPEC